ncbi:hypothetical protein NPIL_336891 [Nephila pilipes]|uniref:Secreted protein n=1 Tax=Nephila pilipes TaxID=299642 RepID=A0A8X6TB12_NEPPI|nr:hypothetical protein NPIL_336891 [Nephila pilipes]
MCLLLFFLQSVIDLEASIVIADILLKSNSHLSKVCVSHEHKSDPRVVPLNGTTLADAFTIVKSPSTPQIKMTTCAESVASVDLSTPTE